MAVIFFFLYSPIAIMAIYSFNASKSKYEGTGAGKAEQERLAK